MACKQGIRDSIQESKAYYKRERKWDPFRELWKSLVHRVYSADGGFGSSSEPEQIYFAVTMLDGEVYNGGMHQFFTNSSGEMYKVVVDGLLELNAQNTLRLLIRAKEILFGENDPPPDQQAILKAIREFPADESSANWVIELKAVEDAYYKNPDNLNERLRAFAETHGLTTPFLKEPQ